MQDYCDGLANATPNWTYDAAGNRASDSTVSGSWTYDNLNRITASPGYTYMAEIDWRKSAQVVGQSVTVGMP